MPESNKLRILVVDDEEDVTDLIRYHFEADNFTVKTINNPNLILGVARDFVPHAVILDVMMPDINGIQICRLLKSDEKLQGTPVIFLSAKSNEDDRISGLETGADDYLTKPFSMKELLLRVKAVIKRSQGLSTDKDGERTGKILVAELEIDEGTHEVFVRGEKIELTATEFKLLRVLMTRLGKVQTREKLLMNVWNYQGDVETRTVDTHIRRLREKLGDQAGLIETIRGVGYRAIEPGNASV